MAKLISLLSIIFLFSYSIQAQDISIKRGATSKTLSLQSYYEILLNNNAEDDASCCDRSLISGRIVRQTIDSISIQFNTLYSYQDLEGTDIQQQYNFSAATPTLTFAKRQVIHISSFKSEKAKKRKEGFSVVGGLLITTGIITAGNFFLIKDSGDRKALLYSGLAQFSVGLGFALSSIRKVYHFKDHKDTWSFGR